MENWQEFSFAFGNGEFYKFGAVLTAVDATRNVRQWEFPSSNMESSFNLENMVKKLTSVIVA